MTPYILFLLFLYAWGLQAHTAEHRSKEVSFLTTDSFSESPERYRLATDSHKYTQLHTYVSGQQGERQFAQTGLLDTTFYDSGFALSLMRGPSVLASYKRYLNQSLWIEVRDIGGATSLDHHKLHPQKAAHIGKSARNYLGDTFIEKPDENEQKLVPINVTSMRFALGSPQFLVGQTRSYHYGMVDVSAGIRPWKVMVYNNVIPVTHMELSIALNGYSTTLRAKGLAVRLFGTTSLDVTIPSRTSEWGMMVGHVPQLRLMAGLQSALSFLRAGLLCGVELGGAEWRMVQDEQRHADRLHAQRRLEADNARLKVEWSRNNNAAAGYDMAARNAVAFGHMKRSALKENVSLMTALSLGVSIQRFSCGFYLSSRLNGVDRTQLSGGLALGWNY